MEKELQEQLKELLKCSDKNCQEGHYPLGMNEDGEIEWGGCPNCVVGSDYLPRVDPYKLKSFIDQNFIGKEVMREKIGNSLLGNVVRFYQSNRGSGHTYASVKGVENTPNAFLLVVDEHQKQNTGLSKEKQISINSRDIILRGRRFALVCDNYTIQEMYRKLLELLK